MVYNELKRYGVHTGYYLSAVEVAASILKNHRKARGKGYNVTSPKARKPMAKLDHNFCKVEGEWLRIPIKPKEYFYVKLHKRALEFLSDAMLRLGSITITAGMVALTFVKGLPIL